MLQQTLPLCVALPMPKARPLLSDKGSLTLPIRHTITAVTQDEGQQLALTHYLEDKAPQLHRNICLPDEAPCQTLLSFLMRYVEHIADTVEALGKLTETIDTYAFAKPLVTMLEGYFLSPPEFISQEHSGLRALVDEAYLAHRLIEEVNDRMMIACGIPLIPMDMTKANLVVHDVLGDAFANELDLAVSYNVDVLFNEKALLQSDNFLNYIAHRKQIGWTDDIKQWPCLSYDASIFLFIDQGKPQLH